MRFPLLENWKLIFKVSPDFQSCWEPWYRSIYNIGAYLQWRMGLVASVCRRGPGLSIAAHLTRLVLVVIMVGGLHHARLGPSLASLLPYALQGTVRELRCALQPLQGDRRRQARPGRPRMVGPCHHVPITRVPVPRSHYNPTSDLYNPRYSHSDEVHVSWKESSTNISAHGLDTEHLDVYTPPGNDIRKRMELHDWSAAAHSDELRVDLLSLSAEEVGVAEAAPTNSSPSSPVNIRFLSEAPDTYPRYVIQRSGKNEIYTWLLFAAFVDATDSV